MIELGSMVGILVFMACKVVKHWIQWSALGILLDIIDMNVGCRVMLYYQSKSFLYGYSIQFIPFLSLFSHAWLHFIITFFPYVILRTWTIMQTFIDMNAGCICFSISSIWAFDAPFFVFFLPENLGLLLEKFWFFRCYWGPIIGFNILLLL